MTNQEIAVEIVKFARRLDVVDINNISPYNDKLYHSISFMDEKGRHYCICYDGEYDSIDAEYPDNEVFAITIYNVTKVIELFRSMK